MQKIENFEIKPETLTTSLRMGKGGKITDNELYYYLNSCPYFKTYTDGHLGEEETLILPFFRFYHLRRMSNEPMSFSTWTTIFTRYLSTAKSRPNYTKLFKKLERCFINFYSIFHSSKKYRVLFPYFPYSNGVEGCVEAVILTKGGVRIYNYDFNEELTSNRLEYHAFKLQCAGRMFNLISGIEPTSLAIVCHITKTTIYLPYHPEEKVEELISSNKMLLRKYGDHCQICIQPSCRPLIDRNDKYWEQILK